MIPGVDITRCNATNQGFGDFFGAEELLNSQPANGSPSNYSQLAIAPSNTNAASSLKGAISNLQTIMQSLLSVLQGIFSTPKDAPLSADSNILTATDPALISTADTTFTQAPIEEPASVIPALNVPANAPTVVNLEELEGSPTTITNNNQTSASEDSSVQSSTRSSSNKHSSSKASSLKGNGEFLWKPVSDKDGKLAVLLPKQYTGKVASVKIISSKDGSTLAKGKYSGVGNGDREHFRFSKSGGSFPDGSIVHVTLKDGQKLEVKIKDTAKRLSK